MLCEQDGRRYRMLDTIREYGAEQLALLSEQDELRRGHRDYYLGLAEQAAAGSLGPGRSDGWSGFGRKPLTCGSPSTIRTQAPVRRPPACA